MEIADYIPNYPELNDPKFNNKILHKKEFYDLRTTSEASPFGKPGDLWPHQQLLGRFLSPYTPYNEQIFFHTPGTGKTCGAAAVVEMNKQDPLVRKPVLIIVPNDTLVNQWTQQIALVCTAGQYVPEHYFSSDPENQLTYGKKVARLNKLVRPVYHITTMERMRREIDKYSDKIIRDKYSNTLIIIDEAHNLRIQSNTTKKNLEASKGRYKSFHRFLHLVTGSKIMLLSGTPMFDRIGELPGLMNLILPLDNQLPTGAKFSKKYLKKSGNVRKITNTAELYKYLVGRVSYIREGGNFPTREDLGDTEWTEFIKTVTVEMSPVQFNGYMQAYKEDVKKVEKDTGTGGKKIVSGMGLWKNTRQAACFVYKTSAGKYLWGTEASALLTSKKPSKKIMIKGRQVTIDPIVIKSQYTTDIKNNLEKYSAKFHKVVTFVQKHSDEPVFVFTPLVSGAGGAIFLGLILRLFGYNKAIGTETKPGKRYALITGEDKSSIQRKTLINKFNSPENRNGELIQVMIATKTISEGTSFTNVKHVMVLSPYWNNSGTEQAVGRGLRSNSLASLPTAERVVTVQELAIKSDKLAEEKNIDAHMYKMSEAKDFEIKSAERLLKKAAWDCALNYDRNVRENDKDGSRSCDYQKCNYVCYQTKPNKEGDKWHYDVPEDELDEETYLLYYSRPELLKVVEKIKGILRKYSYIDINGLNDSLDVQSFKLLILAIEYIIENHVTVYNKWGQPCFLRKEGNMLFLSDIPTEKEILGSWYARYPYANKQIPLSEVIDDDLLREDLKKMSNFKPNTSSAQDVINSLHLETRIFIFEQLLLLEPVEMTEKQTELFDAFMKLFESHIFKVDNMLVHDLEKTKLPIQYVDFTKGDGGSLRCYKDGTWDLCGKKEEEELTTIIKEKREKPLTEITDNEYGVYGILTTDGKFQIADKTKEKGDKSKSDRRTKYSGRVCKTWKKWQLIELYLRVGAQPSIPIDDELTTKKDLLLKAKKQNVTNSIPKNATIETLQIIVTLGQQKVADLCDQLQQWFVDNELIIKQA